jgi:hypothetical protein
MGPGTIAKPNTWRAATGPLARIPAAAVSVSPTIVPIVTAAKITTEPTAAIRAGQRAGQLYDGMSAIDLLAITQRIITSWLGASVGLKAAAGKDPMSARRLKQHRLALVEAVQRITEPH